MVAVAAAAAPYQIDHERSELVVRVFKAGPAAAFAHDHVVRATEWHGTLDVNRAPIALRAEIRVDARALAVDEPAVRLRYGLDGTLADDERAEIRETMLGGGQLDVASHPEIRFRAAEIDRFGSDYRLTGDLTLHGVSRRLSLPIVITESAGALTARGSVRFEQSDFGIEPYRALLGAVRNQDEVELIVNVVATPAGARNGEQ